MESGRVSWAELLPESLCNSGNHGESEGGSGTQSVGFCDDFVLLEGERDGHGTAADFAIVVPGGGEFEWLGWVEGEGFEAGRAGNFDHGWEGGGGYSKSEMTTERRSRVPRMRAWQMTAAGDSRNRYEAQFGQVWALVSTMESHPSQIL